MEVIVTPRAKKLIKKLPKITQITVVEKLKKLGTNVTDKVVKLAGYRDAFRGRVGAYRIVYRILNKKMYVVLVGHRKEVYKRLEQLLK